MVPRGFRRTFLFLEMCRRKCADVVGVKDLGYRVMMFAAYFPVVGLTYKRMN